MEKIYSKINGNLLHIIYRLSDMKPGREDIVDPENYIQCAALVMKEGQTFKPHYHIAKKIDQVFPQESWHVISGRVKCVFYDIDLKIIAEPILEAGDTSFSLGGGHNYVCLEEGSRIIEMKIGPYRGQEQDKVFINE